ncbi:MAG: sensor histidine kinase [Planctomycetota bacterium]
MHSSRFRPLLVMLALTSGTALVAVAGWSLWRAGKEAQQSAVWQAERDAREMARALRAALAQPAVLERCPPANRFAVVDGQLQVDPELAWLEPVAGREAPLLDETLRQAKVAEFVRRDHAEAIRIYDKLLRTNERDPRRPNQLQDGAAAGERGLALAQALAQAAWHSHRANRTARRNQLQAEMRSLRRTAGTTAALRDLRVAEAIAASILLEATLPAGIAGLSSSDWMLLSHAPAAVARPTLERCAELARNDEERTILAAVDQRQRDIAARRRLLRAAQTFLRDAAWRGSPQLDDDRLTLWFEDLEPEQRSGEGRGMGAILPHAWLDSLPGHDDAALPPVPDRGRLVFVAAADLADGDRARAEAIAPNSVARGVARSDRRPWVLPSPPPPLPWLARPTTLLSAALALLLLFVASAWATLRGLSRAHAAMRARTDFLTGVTHELKTPIASMRLIADVLHDDGDQLPSEQTKRYLAMLTGESARLTTLIDNVLDLGQIERGERAYDLQHDCAADAVRETVQGFEALAHHHGIELSLHEQVAGSTTADSRPAESAPAVIDRSAIAQALRNLLENARKYAAAGGRIEVHTSVRDGLYAVRVCDHGPGVPAEERATIFARFVRGSAQQNGSVPGVGLGLFLSREILRHHRGDLVLLDANQSPTPGAAFELTVPLDVSNHSRIAGSDVPAASQSPNSPPPNPNDVPA